MNAGGLQMNVVLIGGFDEAIGFSLAGVKSHMVKDAEEATVKLKECVNDDNIDLLLVSETLAHEMRDTISEFELRDRPMILEIPDRVKIDRDDPIKDIIRKAIGINIER